MRNEELGVRNGELEGWGCGFLSIGMVLLEWDVGCRDDHWSSDCGWAMPIPTILPQGGIETGSLFEGAGTAIAVTEGVYPILAHR